MVEILVYMSTSPSLALGTPSSVFVPPWMMQVAGMLLRTAVGLHCGGKGDGFALTLPPMAAVSFFWFFVIGCTLRTTYLAAPHVDNERVEDESMQDGLFGGTYRENERTYAMLGAQHSRRPLPA